MEKITMIQTNDGKLFDTEAKAKAYLRDNLANTLDTALKDIYHTHPEITRAAIIDIINHLFPNYDTAKHLITSLNNLIE